MRGRILPFCNIFHLKPALRLQSLFTALMLLIAALNLSGLQARAAVFSLADVPAFDGSAAFLPVNENRPYFEESDFTSAAFERYGALDALGRCTAAFACVGTETMPTAPRGAIGNVKPTGWQTVKYDIVDGKYLYNRCHLIGYQLTAENANRQNLITGTRYLNVIGMLPFENMTADYVKETGNHVLYRVTPVFAGDELLARGVLMEAASVEDDGAGILFCVFCYNVQPGIVIDYVSGESRLAADAPQETDTTVPPPPAVVFILNVNTGVFHLESCPSVAKMKEKNKRTVNDTAEALVSRGYKPCSVCKPADAAPAVPTTVPSTVPTTLPPVTVPAADTTTTPPPMDTTLPATTAPVYTTTPATTAPAYTTTPATTAPVYTTTPATTAPAYTTTPATTAPAYTTTPAATATTAPETVTTTTPVTAPGPAAHPKGDVDLDGSVTAADARLTLRAAVGLEIFSEAQRTLSDIDLDGKVTAADARLTLRIAVGLDLA